MHRVGRFHHVQEHHGAILDLAQHHGFIGRVAQGNQMRPHGLQPGIACLDLPAQGMQLGGRVIPAAAAHFVQIAARDHRAHQRQATRHRGAQTLRQFRQRHRSPRLCEQLDQFQRPHD
ncbi:hypothetical protein G6F31_018883 [Rhizopus arrhizus]|nr:hypothetical protein G6F31_018883 [Rhizopus arrhizus]